MKGFDRKLYKVYVCVYIMAEEKLSLLDETKQAIEELRREKEEISKIKDELQKLRSEQLLSGSSGGHVQPEPKPVITNREYAEKMMRGEVNPLKEDGISIN